MRGGEGVRGVCTKWCMVRAYGGRAAPPRQAASPRLVSRPARRQSGAVNFKAVQMQYRSGAYLVLYEEGVAVACDGHVLVAARCEWVGVGGWVTGWVGGRARGSTDGGER